MGILTRTRLLTFLHIRHAYLRSFFNKIPTFLYDMIELSCTSLAQHSGIVCWEFYKNCFRLHMEQDGKVWDGNLRDVYGAFELVSVLLLRVYARLGGLRIVPNLIER